MKATGSLDGCPNPLKIAKDFTEEWAIARYTECSLVSSFIIDQAKSINHILASNLSCSKLRHAVPNDYMTILSPGSSLPGYAASRILIEMFGRKPPWKIGDERVKQGIDLLHQTFGKTSDPIEFVVLLAEAVVTAGIDPTAVLGHLLAVEHLDEGLYTDIKTTWAFICKKAPSLQKHYLSLIHQQRLDFGILPDYLVTV